MAQSNASYGLEELFKQSQLVNSESQYWLVRSMGGDYYKEYITRGYIAIGYNEISLNEIKLATTYGDKAIEELKLIAESKNIKSKNNNDEEEFNAQYASVQLLKFYRDMKIGDIIIIPGKNSDNVAIARIESNAYEEEKVSKLTGVCNFSKRRRIKVINKMFRSKLNPKMQLMFSSRHIISNVDRYAQYIDSCISDYYQKDGYTFLVLRVEEENSISANDFGLIPELIKLLEDYIDEKKIGSPVEDVKMKTCVQSPGDILMYAPSWEMITLIGMFIMLLKGGEISCSKQDGFKFKTGTILQSVSEFLDRRRDRKFKESIRKKLDNMKIETPKDLTEIMKEFNDKRNPY